MSWLDDRLWCHPKILGVPKPVRWEYAAAVMYSSGFHTGGRLSAGQLKAIECTTKDRAALIKVGLWEDDGEGGIIIHDWDDHNGKRDARRASDRARKRAARANERPQDKVRTDAGQTSGQSAERRALKEVKEVTGEGTDVLGVDSDLEAKSKGAEDPFPQTEDPAFRLLRIVRHKDPNTDQIIRSFVGRVPEAAFDYTRDELDRCRETTKHDGRFAIHILNRIKTEGMLASPAPAANSNGATPEPEVQMFDCEHCGKMPGGPRTRAQHMHTSHGHPHPDDPPAESPAVARKAAA